MPTFTTPVFDAQNEARANLSRLAEPNLASGTVEWAVIPYTIVGTEAVNDILNLFLLPKDCLPLPQLCSVTSIVPAGTTFTLSIGTAANTVGFTSALATTSAREVEFTSAAVPPWVVPTPVVPDTGSGNAIVKATVTAVSALTPGAVLYFTFAWKRER